MMLSRLGFTSLLVVLAASVAVADTPKDASRKPLPEKMPRTGLKPAQLIPDLCLLKYRISTTAPECQAFFDQGLGWAYSYAWMEAARSMETAVLHDPDCPMAWWGLSRALEGWGKKKEHLEALKKAQELMNKASDREQHLIKARLQHEGLWPGVGKEKDARLKAAIQTIDELLALYGDDQEGWNYRAYLANNFQLFGGKLEGVPFYKALLHINPLHPAANHELIHFYESFHRPALGVPYAEGYLQSSPGIPHALHMQAHLAMRLGRWGKTTDRSAKAVELHRAYHKRMGIKPKEDAQYSHHLETLLHGLIHDGRFAEAREIKKATLSYGFKHPLPWFQLHMAERDYDSALQVATEYFQKDRTTQAYLKALVYLARDELSQARSAVEVLEQAYQKNRKDKKLERYMQKVQGMLMCRQGGVDPGLKLLKKLVDWSKSDYGAHSWGAGAYFMNSWGSEALRAGRFDVAEEAFLEAIAHDPGSVRAALAMQAICEHQHRTEEAQRFAELAQRCWNRAAPESLRTELESLRRLLPVSATATVTPVQEHTIRQP